MAKKLLMLSSAVPGISLGGGRTVMSVGLYQSFGLVLSLRTVDKFGVQTQP